MSQVFDWPVLLSLVFSVAEHVPVHGVIDINRKLAF